MYGEALRMELKQLTAAIASLVFICLWPLYLEFGQAQLAQLAFFPMIETRPEVHNVSREEGLVCFLDAVVAVADTSWKGLTHGCAMRF